MKTNEQLINEQRNQINLLNYKLTSYERQNNILNNYILKLINNEIDLNQLQEYYNKIKKVTESKPENENEQLNKIFNEITNNKLFAFIMFLIEKNTESKQEINETLLFILDCE